MELRPASADETILVEAGAQGADDYLACAGGGMDEAAAAHVDAGMIHRVTIGGIGIEAYDIAALQIRNAADFAHAAVICLPGGGILGGDTGLAHAVIDEN